MQIGAHPSPAQYPAWLSIACPGLSANAAAGNASYPFKINLCCFETRLSMVQAQVGLANKIQDGWLNENFR